MKKGALNALKRMDGIKDDEVEGYEYQVRMRAKDGWMAPEGTVGTTAVFVTGRLTHLQTAAE